MKAFQPLHIVKNKKLLNTLGNTVIKIFKTLVYLKIKIHEA